MRRQSRPGEKKRTLVAENIYLERRHHSRRLPVAHHQAARTEAVERFHERRLPDRVIHHLKHRAVRDFLHARDEILAAIVDHMVAAVGLREFCLLVAADRADNGRAQMLRPLA